MSTQGRGNPNIVRSAVKVLDALRLICSDHKPVLASELAEELGISVPTAYRAAETLIACGFVRHAPNGQGYLPTMDVVELAGNVVDQVGIRTSAREILVEVARAYGETITVAVRDGAGDDIVFIDRIEGTRDLRFFCDVGRRLPLHAGAAARCMLAHLQTSEFEAYLDRGERAALTPKTRVASEALERDRIDIRKNGYAISIDEVDIGVSAVGAPIIDRDGSAFAVIAIANLTVRWSRAEVRARAIAMREAAGRIQQQLWSSRHATEVVS